MGHTLSPDGSMADSLSSLLTRLSLFMEAGDEKRRAGKAKQRKGLDL